MHSASDSKIWAKSVKVNALLDDGSEASYIDTQLAEELGLRGPKEEHSVSVVNGSVETFDAARVGFEVESLDGKTILSMKAYTSDRVTGDMEVVDWQQQADRWKHLRSIPFPELSSRPGVALLIGVNCMDAHTSRHDIKGANGEPIARLTPLGWSCVCVKQK